MDKFKKIIAIGLGNSSNLRLKFNIVFFTMGVVFMAFGFVKPDNDNMYYRTLVNLSALFFALGIIFSTHQESIYKIAIEAGRLISFLFLFLYSLEFWFTVISNGFKMSTTSFLVSSLIWTFALLISILYIITKFMDVFNALTKLFEIMRVQIFKTATPAASKLISLIENVTVFLASVGALSIAILTITETINKIFSYFK